MEHYQTIHWIIFGLKFLCAVALFIASFSMLIPSGLKAYEQWVKTQKIKELSSAVMSFMFALFFVAFVGISLVSSIFKLDLTYGEFFTFEYGLIRLALVIGLVFFIAYYAVPKAVGLFRRWKETRQSKYFSMMVLLGTLSVYAISIILTLHLPVAAK